MAKRKPQSKRLSLAERAKNTAPPNKRTYKAQNFFERLPADQQEELLELREQFVSGELGIYWTPRTLLNEIVIPAGIELNVSLQTWRKWLHEGK